MRKRKILIVDDEPGFTKIVKLTLEAENRYEVREENNPQVAVQTAREFRPDLVLLDIIMPQLDGGDVLSQIRADPMLQNTPVVFLTAAVRKTEVWEHGGNIGGNFYVAKPVSVDELISCIEEHVKE